LGFESRVFGLEDAAKNLEGIAAVLHCAGPFSATARPMLDACLAAGAHYLDITGEIAVFEAIHARRAEIEQRGIVAIPGVGFDVVPTDCLAAMLKERLPGATHLKLAFRSRQGQLSPGTVKTMIESLPEGGKVRREGRIVTVPVGYKIETIAFTPERSYTAITIPWGDVATAYYSTGIPNIEVFLGASENQIKRMKLPGWIAWLLARKGVQAFLKRQVSKRVKGPDERERAADEMLVYGEASDADVSTAGSNAVSNAGGKAVLRLRTPAGYSLTADSAITATCKVLEGKLAPGAYTPSMAFGAQFVLGLEGVELLE
jgi:short subunit dehydrogenase-like uncharacterized protein